MRAALKLFGLLLLLNQAVGAELADDRFESVEAIVAALTPVKAYANIDGIHLSIDLDIRFALGSSELLPGAERQIDALATALRSDDLLASKILLVGHTDLSGSDAHNVRLSRARANAVAERLVTTHGLPNSRLQVEGRGSRQLLDGLPETDARHRRVEVIAIPATESSDPGNGAATPAAVSGAKRIKW